MLLRHTYVTWHLSPSQMTLSSEDSTRRMQCETKFLRRFFNLLATSAPSHQSNMTKGDREAHHIYLEISASNEKKCARWRGKLCEFFEENKNFGGNIGCDTEGPRSDLKITSLICENYGKISISVLKNQYFLQIFKFDDANTTNFEVEKR